MSDRASGRVPDPLPRPTPRQLLIRSIGTLGVFAVLIAGAIVAFDQADEPADVEDLVEQPRTVSYGRLSLQIPREWTLNDVDDCGHVQGDTLILGNAGIVTCPQGERAEDASDVVMSSLRGRLAAPAPRVELQERRLPSGLNALIGRTEPDPPTEPTAEPTTSPEAPDPDEAPLVTTVLRLPGLDAQVVATSRDTELVNSIVDTAMPVPDDSEATQTISYLRAAIDLPRTWSVNDLRCGTPLSDTVALGYPGKPRFTAVPGEPCPPDRPNDVTYVTLDSLSSDFGERWVVLAGDPVTLLGNVDAVRGVKQLPDGQTVTVMAVPTLDVIAVARSSDQPLVDKVLSTLHQAVPPQPDEEQTAPTPSPDPSPRPTLPAGLDTRRVTSRGVALFVPTSWSRNDVRCGTPQSDTVVLDATPTDPPQCEPSRPPGVSSITVERLYSPYGSLWQATATEPVMLASGLSALRGQLVGADGAQVSVLAFPSLDVIIVGTAADEGTELELVEAILATTRRATDEGGPPAQQ